MKKAKYNSLGLLLIEALLSVLILSIAITASVRSLAYAVKVNSITKNYQTALQLIEEKLSEYEIKSSIKEGHFSGAFPYPYAEFIWDCDFDSIIKIGDEQKKESQTQYYKMHLTLSWFKGEKHSINVDTILLKNSINQTENNDEKEK